MKNLELALLMCLTLSLASSVMAQNQHAFLWDSTTGMTDLGTLGGNSSYALGINDSGQVAGYSYLADNVTIHAFIWSAAPGMVDLGTDGGADSRAWAINASGDVAGGLSVQRIPDTVLLVAQRRIQPGSRPRLQLCLWHQ
jgi:probable HAF family extracellular repeat protein